MVDLFDLHDDQGDVRMSCNELLMSIVVCYCDAHSRVDSLSSHLVETSARRLDATFDSEHVNSAAQCLESLSAPHTTQQLQQRDHVEGER